MLSYPKPMGTQHIIHHGCGALLRLPTACFIPMVRISCVMALVAVYRALVILDTPRLVTQSTLAVAVRGTRLALRHDGRARRSVERDPKQPCLQQFNTGRMQRPECDQKSRGKGKLGKVDIPRTPGPICNQTGYWKRYCWYNTSNVRDAKPKSKGKRQGHTWQESETC